MDLRKRLASLDRMTRKVSPGSDRPGPAERSATWLADLGLEETATPAGPVFKRDYTDEVVFPGGDLPDLHGFFTRELPETPAVEHLLWLDTETTGLAGGTGTLAFLVGVSWWRDDRFHTRQFFLPGPEHEAAMLGALGRLAADFEVVVTFNGASFDLPLLRTRALMNRDRDPCAHLAGWDLLVPSRRLFGRRLPDCRQQTLEHRVCRIDRADGDIDGALIPATWFDFLATGQTGRLADVLRHNRRDMTGMARIFAEIWRQADRTPPDQTAGSVDWQSGWALGRIHERVHRRAASIAWLTAAVRDPNLTREGGFARPEFVADALRILKRGGDTEQVAGVLTAAFTAGLETPWLHREAAILWEHRRVDLARALHHARRCGEDTRIARLTRKLDRQGD